MKRDMNAKKAIQVMVHSASEKPDKSVWGDWRVISEPTARW